MHRHPVCKVRLRVAPHCKGSAWQSLLELAQGWGIRDLRVSREMFRESRRGAKKGNIYCSQGVYDKKQPQVTSVET